jgi:cysteine-rich repeat protein
VCGDLIVTTSAPVSEQCDDGNLDDGDGCSATCTVE